LELSNLYDPKKKVIVDAFVNTGSQLIVLPETIKDSLGIKETNRVEIAMADGSFCEAEVGRIEFQIRCFRKAIGEAMFVSEYFEILIGYIALESSNTAVDALGHRLVTVRYFDMRKNKHSTGRFLGSGFSKIWH